MRVLIVFNPTSGRAGQSLAGVCTLWHEQGWQVELCPTAGPGEGTRYASQAASQGYDLVVAAGGDGTINEVINGLAGTDTALATLPLGTMNVWARESGLPLEPMAAASALLHGQVRTLDLGRANGRYFLLMAGIGFDAAITQGVHPLAKRLLGGLAYVVHGLQVALGIQGTRVRLVLDGQVLEERVLLVVIGNSQLYGGIVKITDRASMDDGLLDVRVFKGNDFASALHHTFAVLLKRSDSQDLAIDYYQARTIQIQASPALLVQIDGDPIGQTPMTFEVVPRALRVWMPKPNFLG
ncbi:diacylglycerol/lipid kinase family protein [Anthocerotibacter panamensis]|uniref:diacylglycerol/lipid kinase family protein n=1 Tax=Anthocerotibacter panamensis TaxID=2857077 RepID=UPI001C401592|nr:diacylglycerol kinase family protein [Anthocerotibacter panamensis]